MPYDTSKMQSRLGLLNTHTDTESPLFPINQPYGQTPPSDDSSSFLRGTASFGALLIGRGGLRGLSVFCNPFLLCVCDFKRVSEGLFFFFFFLKLILFCKVRCHVAESYYSGDRWCYDWTKSDSLFRILIGTCGSHKTLVHGAVLCDYIFMFPFSLFFAFLILCSEAYDDCSSFSWNYRLNFILMSIWLAVCLRLHW